VTTFFVRLGNQTGNRWAGPQKISGMSRHAQYGRVVNKLAIRPSSLGNLSSRNSVEPESPAGQLRQDRPYSTQRQ
jgi:hypothetical protein